MTTDAAAEIEIKFGFDPFQSESLKPIVIDPVAFSLWAMWKRSHIVSDKFIDDVLVVSHLVKRRQPKDVAELMICFPSSCHDFPVLDVQKFAPEWLEVLSGRTSLYMIINGERYYYQVDAATVTQ